MEKKGRIDVCGNDEGTSGGRGPFRHETKRWDPKMKPYIFGARNGIYIIDLQKTVQLFKDAYPIRSGYRSNGEYILFVGTKKQAQETISDQATRCGMFYVNHRWLGGMLTNFQTIKRSIDRLNKLEAMRTKKFTPSFRKKRSSNWKKREVSWKKPWGALKIWVGSLEPSSLSILRRKELP